LIVKEIQEALIDEDEAEKVERDPNGSVIIHVQNFTGDNGNDEIYKGVITLKIEVGPPNPEDVYISIDAYDVYRGCLNDTQEEFFSRTFKPSEKEQVIKLAQDALERACSWVDSQ
jgi:hypothetical protein